MSDETKPDQLPMTEDETVTPLDVVTDLVLDTTIPAPIRKGAFKAFGQLCTALIDVPLGGLRRRDAEKWAETKARIKIIGENADQIAQQMKVPSEYARRAENKFAEKIIREQINLDKTSVIAANELKTEEFHGSTDQSADSGEEKTISDDFLNSFEEEVRQKSSEEMQLLFGRILAGEIRKPGTYSIRTVKVLGQLDQNAAGLFRRACSMCAVIEIPIGGTVVDIRIPSLSSHPEPYMRGLDYSLCNMLQEYGLIVSEFNSFFHYNMCIVNQNPPAATAFLHQGRHWVLVPLPGWNENQDMKVLGVAFSRAGCELFPVVDLDPMEDYTADLKKFFAEQNLQMIEVPIENKI